MRLLKPLFFLFTTLIAFSLQSQNTYYWVHNDVTTVGNQYSKDQVNATNSGPGTAFWKHFSKVAGSVALADLLPATTPITSLDNIIVNNSSVPTRTVIANYVINVDNTGGGLICQDFDASAWGPPAGQLQRLGVNILTNLQVYRHLRMSPSDRFNYLQGTTLTFPNNSAAAVDSVHLYNTNQQGGNTFRYTGNLNINIFTNGKVYFCDTIRCSTANGPVITIRANDNIGLTHETHFLENISRVATITVEAGNLYMHKNITDLRNVRVGGGFGSVNGPSPNTVNSRFYAHAPGFYSSPGVWNAGYWNDPAYVAQGQNVWGRLQALVANRGIVDVQNTRMQDVSITFQGNKGRGTIGSDSVGFFTNQTTYLRFRSAGTTFNKPISITNCACTGYTHKGTWVIDQNSVIDNVTDYFTSASPQFYHDSFDDTLLVATNLNGWGAGVNYTYSITINPTGYAKFFPGYTYNFGNIDYLTYPGTILFTNKGKLVVGDSRGCDSTATKWTSANLVMSGAGTQTVANVQIENSKIQGAAAARTILGSNTDMGGNSGFLFSLAAGQLTTNGVVPSTTTYAYGTAPYNSIPFTARTPRTLIWNDVASGSVTKYWSEKKWADVAISSVTFDQCPPTFIDSVIVSPGSTLKIDQRATQCKSFVALAGAPITLSQKVTNSADSLSTLQIFGSFILNQKINNMLNRNIMFRAWQTYPQIKTSGTNFWRGLNFFAINSGAGNPNLQINNGSWTLMDSLCAYNQDIVFTPRSNSAPECKKINFDKITYAINDPINNFHSPGGTNNAVNVYFNYMLYLSAGNLYTNNKNIHTYNFYVHTDGSLKKKLYLGSSTFNLYDGTGEYYNVSGSNIQTYATSWCAADQAVHSFTLFAGTSHIKFHSKTFMGATFQATTNNATTNSFGCRGNRYYDVSFLCNDSTIATYKRSTNSLSAPIYTITGGTGITRSGIGKSINCNFHNITFWSSDASYPQMQTYRDTISKITFKYNAGSLNSGAITTCSLGSSGAIPMSATVTNSSIDSLIFNTKINSINASSVLPGSGLYNIKKYLFFTPGSTNTFQPGDKHRLYNNTSVVAARNPWNDNSPAVPPDNPSYVAPAPYTSYTISPYGAKVKSQAQCDAPTILKYGGFANAGNAVAYPTPYHWSGVAPRDTFDIKNWLVIDDSLTQFQTVDASINLSGSTLNWDAGTFTPRTLVFRDGGTTNASWFDKTRWAKVISYSPYTISAVGECIPQCGDSVIFDNASFSAPTNTCDLGVGNSAYCGTMYWKTGVTGIFSGASTSALTICNSLYFNPTMNNSFQGQTVFTAIDSNKVEYIQSSNKTFNNQVYFNARNPSKYKTAWKLLDSLTTLPIANSIIPAMKINAGIFDTRGKNLNITGGFDISSTKNRGVNFHNSQVRTTGGRPGYTASGSGVAFNIDGDYTKLKFKADSSDIYASSTSSATPAAIAYAAHFYVWSGIASSQFYTAAPKGFKFNRITINALTTAGGTIPTINLRSDTVATLTLNGRPNWQHFYKGYVRYCALNNQTTAPSQAVIGNTNGIASPLLRFNKGRIDTLRLTHRYAGGAAQCNWDTLYVKNELTIQPGSSIQFAKGGLTWFSNRCTVQLLGTAALPISLNTNSSIGTTYNYPSGNRLQNEHYFRKDSGSVCTDYAQLYNIWAIGNGNGNNSCVGGVTFGCTDAVANSSAYGTWMAPVMSPTLGVRTLSDTTFYSSETPNFPTSGRARFLAGNNADFGDPNPLATHNTAGWDGSPYAGFPGTQLVLSQYTVCPNTAITATMNLTGALKSKDFPITITYSVGGVQSVYTFTSSSANPYVFTFTTTATTNTNVTWSDMTNTRCFNNVQAVGASANITILPTPTINAVASNTAICIGAASTLSVSGATSYTWSTTQNTTTITVSPTVTTSYSVVGTNTAGCSNSPPAIVTVTVNNLPSLSLGAQTNVLCYGNATGAVTLTPSGGTGSGYTILPTSTVNLAAGTYTYNVKDGANCTSTVASVTITQPASALTAMNTTTNNTDCITPSGSAFTTPNGGTSGYTYTWLPGGENTQGITGQTGGTYTVIVTDANMCAYSTQAVISNPSSPVITATSNTNTICFGNSITITPGGGGTTFTITPSVGTATTGITGATVFTPTASTSYSVVGTNSTNCISNTVNLNITVNTTPTVAVSAVSNSVICSGNTTTITASGTNNYTLTSATQTLTSNPFVVSPGTTTTYTLTGMSSSNCPASNMANATINVNATPTVAISSVSNPIICSGNSTTITPTGANSYILVSSTQVFTVSPFVVSPSANTTYTLTGLSSANCPSGNTANTTINVNVTPTVGITNSAAAICVGQSMSLTASGATSYTWTSPASTNTTIVVSPATTQIYTVQGTSSNCNSALQTATVHVNQLPIITAATITNVSCFGAGNGSIAFTTGSGTPSYTIAGTNISGSIANTLSPNTYTYTVTDAAGCINTTTAAITQPTASLLSSAAQTSTNTSCVNPDGVATVTITGGTSGYTISPSSGLVSGNTITGLGTGIHSYSVTDVNGCSTSNTVQINGATGISGTILSQANELCYGNSTASVTVSGLNEASGTYNYTMTPITGTTTSTSNSTGVFTNLSSGTYSVLIIGGVSNCMSSQNITITQPTAPLGLTGITTNPVICNGGTAQATATVTGGTSPYTYVWSTNTSTTSIATYTAGVYSVNISDGNGCSLPSQNFTVTESPVLSISSVATATTGCNLSNGTATITPVGGWSASYTYSVNGVSQSTNTTTGLTAGTYTASITDALGCSTSTVFNITNPASATLSIVSNTPAICIGQSTTLTPTGASSYTLDATSPFAANIGVTPATTTVYQVTGTDANNCITAPMNVTVTVNALPVLTLTASNTVVCSGSTTTLTATGADNYSWSTATTGSTLSVTPVVTQTVSVIGTNTLTGCVSTVESFVVNVNALPNFAVDAVTNVSCFGGSNGAVTFTTNVASSVISPAGSGLAAGTYSFNITDNATGCTNSVNATITEPTLLSVAAAQTSTNSSCVTPDGIATVTITGGTSGYTISPSSGTVSGNNITNLATGVYNYTVTDANNCITSNTVQVTGAAGINSTLVSQNNILCFGNTTGSVSVTGLNESSGVYNYSLTPITGTTSAANNATGVFTNLSSGTYSVLITGGTSNCISSQNITITGPSSALSLTGLVADSVICNGGSAIASASVTGGTTPYTYVWSSIHPQQLGIIHRGKLLFNHQRCEWL